jgi:hypothetical protein
MADQWTPTPEGGNDPNAFEVSFNLVDDGGLKAIVELTAAVERMTSFMEQFQPAGVQQRQRSRTAFASQAANGIGNTGSQPPPIVNEYRAPGQQGALFATDEEGTVQPAPQRPAIPQRTGEAQAGELQYRRVYQAGAPILPDEPQAAQRPPSGEPVDHASRAPLRPPRSPYQAAYEAQRTTDREYQEQGDEEDIERLQAMAPSGLHRRLDRTLQMAHQLGGHLHAFQHQGALQGALGVGTNVAMMRTMSSDATESSPFMQSLMASTLANRMAVGNMAAGGTGGHGGEHGHQGIASLLQLGVLGLAMGRNATAAQSNMGFDPGQTFNLPGTDIGIQLPSFNRDSRMRENLDRVMNIQRLRMQGGISGRQAHEIFGALNAEGFSGQEAENMAFDTVGPLVRQGQNPGLATNMVVQAIRNGNASLEEVSATMTDLGTSARNAHLNLDEFTQQLDQFAEQAQNLGAYRNQGVQLGRTLSDATGIAPVAIAPVLQSPLFQAMAFQNQGVMPNAVGAMGGGDVINQTGNMIDLAMRAARPFGNRVSPTGQHLTAAQARQNQLIQAAQFAGMPLEVFTRLERNRSRLGAFGQAGEAFGNFGRVLNNAEHDRSVLPHVDRNRTHAGMAVSGQEAEQNASRADRLDRARDRVSSEIDSRVREGWRPVHEALVRAAPGRPGDTSDRNRVDYFNKIRDLEREDDPRTRLERARDLLKTQTEPRDQRPEYRLDLTPEARRLVRILGSNDPAKDDAQRGARPINENRNRPGHQPLFGVGGWTGG